MKKALPPADAEFGQSLLADVVAKVEAGDMTGACALLASVQPALEGDSAGHAVLISMNIVKATWTLSAAAMIAGTFSPREGAALEAIVAEQKRFVENIYATNDTPTDVRN